MHHPAVGQTALGQSRGGESGIAITDFDPQKIGLGLIRRRRRQKQSLAAADFHFDRRIATEQRHGIPRGGKIRRHFEMSRQVEVGLDWLQRTTAHRQLPGKE